MSVSLSILIPTKDREVYLLDLVNYILTWESNDFEIIVQDNGDSNILCDKIKGLNDTRIKYFHQSGWLSVVDNFDLALKKSSGKVITMLGDDDGVFEEVINVANWMINTNVDAVLPEKGTYVWPGLKTKYNSSFHSSNFRIKESFSSKLDLLDAKEELLHCFNLGGTSIGLLPRLYYGLIKKDVLDSVYEITGTYFPGPSPDMANAVSSALIINSFYRLNYPLFIAGSCVSSAAGMGVQRKHEGDLSQFPHLPKDCELNWEKEIPKFWSGSTIWAESAIKASKKMGADVFLESFNYPYLYARCLVFNYRRIEDVLANFSQNRLWFKSYLVLFYYCKVWFDRFRSFMPKLIARFYRNKVANEILIESMPTLSGAMYEYSRIKKSKNIKLSFLLSDI